MTTGEPIGTTRPPSLKRRLLTHALYAYAFAWGFTHPAATTRERTQAAIRLLVWAQRRGLLLLWLLVWLPACAPTDADWERVCAAHGGRLYRQHIYKGELRLCLTPDGRVLVVDPEEP